MSNYYSYENESDVSYGGVVRAARGRFLTQTYVHLFAAILLFVLIEVALFSSGTAETICRSMLGRGGGVAWLVIIGGYMLLGTLATHIAQTASSKAAQYGALIFFVALEALIFVPMLWMANKMVPGGGMIQSAAVITLGGFGLLTAIVFMTRADFSFLRGILFWASICALLLIVGGMIFGFNLGMAFSVAMVALAGGWILYDTSNILHHYSEDRYVGAALALFSSVAMMFWYVLRIFMQSRD